MKKKVAIFLALCVMMNLMLEEKPKMIYFNATSSLPQGFYLRIPGEGCRSGDYVIYEPSEEIKTLIVKNGWGDGERDFLKKVGATAGEEYSVDAETLKFEIEGKYIGQVYETDTTGNFLPKLRGKFEVSKGYVLPIATSARSFDGRYSGAISERMAIYYTLRMTLVFDVPEILMPIHEGYMSAGKFLSENQIVEWIILMSLVALDISIFLKRGAQGKLPLIMGLTSGICGLEDMTAIVSLSIVGKVIFKVKNGADEKNECEESVQQAGKIYKL